MIKISRFITATCIYIIAIICIGDTIFWADNTSAFASSDEEISIPRSVEGDKGKYYLINKMKSGKYIIAIHKRDGVYETVYTKTKINCANMTYRILGKGRTEKTIVSTSWDWAPLVAGSSNSDLLHFVCR